MAVTVTDPEIASGPSAVDWLLQRRRGPQTVLAAAIVVLSMALSLFHFYSTYYGQTEVHAHRSTHLAFMVILAFLFFPFGRRHFSDPLGWPFLVDAAFIGIALGAQLYTLVSLNRFVDPGYSVTTTDVAVGTLLILTVLEAARRTVGWGLTLTAIFFLLQTWQADKFVWILYGPPNTWTSMVESFFGKEEGLYGIPVGIMSSVLILFIIFAAFLSMTGIGDFFVRLATALAGRMTGGPAKVSVFSSAMLGTISGSGVANVMMDGVFTIPMMKRIGYGATFAGAVEAVASIGGQIMPPIMAAAAFIMADFVGVPFRKIALAATIPAILYFGCVFVTVHLEAKRLGLRKVPRDEMPRLGQTLRVDGYLLLPLVALIGYLYYGFSEEMAALMAVGTTFLVSFVRRRSALGPVRLLKAFESGARAGVTVAMAVAAAGLIIGCLFLSGIGMKFSYMLMNLSGGQLWLALIYTTVAALLLGLSLPTTAVYLTLAIIVAPGLVQMGVPKMAAHMFIFYMGVTSDLTPPTCLSPFAAAAIAGSPPMATAWQAMRLGAVLFIVPFMFVYQPALLMIGSWPEIVLALARAAFGVVCLAAGLQGWLRSRATPFDRALLLAAGILFVVPSAAADVVGLALLALVWGLQSARRAPEIAPAPAASLD
ncbi:MAG TPA: TRAP transporter fused permease subunit [Methylomirabilota bacterium]|nr:TRAP transporter fused permease subunit [Methylomirabilota bacterium]